MKRGIFIVTMGLAVAGCSVQTRYRVLSFFFDGVPVPASMRIVTAEGAEKKNAAVSAKTRQDTSSNTVIHPPYRDGRCSACHVGQFSSSLVKPANVLCLDCHGGFNQLSPYVHGPVASGFCTACHNPHSSQYPHLTIRPKNSLCLACHIHLNETRSKGHADMGQAECLSCHDPHSVAGSRYLLKKVDGIE